MLDFAQGQDFQIKRHAGHFRQRLEHFVVIGKQIEVFQEMDAVGASKGVFQLRDGVSILRFALQNFHQYHSGKAGQQVDLDVVVDGDAGGSGFQLLFR